jgi:hypothetical protein
MGLEVLGGYVYLVGRGVFFGLASWCVAFGSLWGSEETPPTRRIAPPSGGSREAWQQSRNDTSAQTGDEACVMSSALGLKR